MNNNPEKMYLYFQGTYFHIKLPDGSNYKPTNELEEFPKSFVKQREIYNQSLKITDISKKTAFIQAHFDDIKLINLNKQEELIKDRVLSIEFDSEDKECYVIYVENLMKYINENLTISDIFKYYYNFQIYNNMNLQNGQDESNKTNIIKTLLESFMALLIEYNRRSSKFNENENNYLKIFIDNINDLNLIDAVLDIAISIQKHSSFINLHQIDSFLGLKSEINQLLSNDQNFSYNFIYLPKYMKDVTTSVKTKESLKNLLNSKLSAAKELIDIDDLFQKIQSINSQNDITERYKRNEVEEKPKKANINQFWVEKDGELIINFDFFKPTQLARYLWKYRDDIKLPETNKGNYKSLLFNFMDSKNINWKDKKEVIYKAIMDFKNYSFKKNAIHKTLLLFRKTLN